MWMLGPLGRERGAFVAFCVCITPLEVRTWEGKGQTLRDVGRLCM